jgi:dolichol kinase
MSPRHAAAWFGVAHLAKGALIGAGVFAGLPARWAPVDAVAAALVALEVGSGVALLAGTRWAGLAARIAALGGLAVGLLAITALGLSVSWLLGVYGPVGKGGGLLFALVAALLFPYLLVLPCAEILWLRSRAKDCAV